MPGIYMYFPLMVVLAVFAAFFIGWKIGLSEARSLLTPTERRRLEGIATGGPFYGELDTDPEAGMRKERGRGA